MAIGKISGPMLQSDLARQGVDLSIDTDLAYYDVANRQVGINTAFPTSTLTVNGNISSPQYYIGNIASATGANIVIIPSINGIVDVNSTTAIAIPRGTTAQEPSGVPVGSIRYNTDSVSPEFYNGVNWIAMTASVEYQTFSGNSTGNTFPLNHATTSGGIIVSLNGVQQTPGVAYTVTGNAIIFAETPLTTDNVDIRYITSGQAPMIGNVTGNLVVGGSTSLGSTLLVGPSTSANFTRFPNTIAVISSVAANIQQNESNRIGLVSEGIGDSANVWGIGIYGVGYTNSAARSSGVVGESHVSASADVGSAIGVRGYANDTHAGGLNIGLYGEAVNGSGNYALYMNRGNIFSANTQTWTLVDNTASALSIDASGKTGIISVTTTDNAEGVTMSGTLGVTGNLTANTIIASNISSNSGTLTFGGNIVGNVAGYAVGYRDIPQKSTGNANLTLAVTDGGKHYLSTTTAANIIYIPTNANVPLSTGSAITVIVQGTGNIQVVANSGVTLYMAGNSTSGSNIRSISSFGVATLLKTGTDTWFINGAGVF